MNARQQVLCGVSLPACFVSSIKSAACASDQKRIVIRATMIEAAQERQI